MQKSLSFPSGITSLTDCELRDTEDANGGQK